MVLECINMLLLFFYWGTELDPENDAELMDRIQTPLSRTTHSLPPIHHLGTRQNKSRKSCSNQQPHQTRPYSTQKQNKTQPRFASHLFFLT